ncbi:sensor histidine kinase [Janibacter sp. G56]|uniref:sensor histidine kinase n=1 Tax=Janibacter sp. G56 TaxID=3418717 RepID=UPI003D02616D
MESTTAAILGATAGLLLGLVAVGSMWVSDQSRRSEPVSGDNSLPEGVGDVLAVLRSIGIVLDSSDAVVNHSPSAVAHGLVRRGELVHAELRHLAERVRRDGEIREVELELPRGPISQSGTFIQARVAPLGSKHVLLLLEDRTQSKRLEEVRRDFVANVSHELKTPVGGIALLAEAVLDAHDDPEAVARFAQRIQVESTRLTRLVKEIIDLSRLQAAENLDDPARIDVAAVIAEAIDYSRVGADAKNITIATRSVEDLHVFGDHDLLVTAVRNLIGNAVSYSDPDTRVGVGMRQVGDIVEISVTDQGHGISEADQERIFERFYRIDAARSRATGGTGLGLAIVKHVCANHGGDVTVWSEEGRGSTFTIRLPAAGDPDARAGSPTGHTSLHPPTHEEI